MRPGILGGFPRMKIKVLECLAGVDYVRYPGEVFVCDDAEALRLIAAGFAVPVADEPEVSVPEPEKRAKRKSN
jgi:hypothetical protein